MNVGVGEDGADSQWARSIDRTFLFIKVLSGDVKKLSDRCKKRRARRTTHSPHYLIV